MFRITILRPAQPSAYRTAVRLYIQSFPIIQFGCGTAKVFLYTLADKCLISVENKAYEIKPSPVLVFPVFSDRENLFITFQVKVQIHPARATNL